ncbi:hypothetical protein BDV26DRAFT_289857 [Aspergillus bertholletiae]|uniref:Cytochrome P450 n=1 Tax=Aspergillus bertholletiae TaxID=1226010 RepID=A0A5N7BGP8_9EURO|nr:hypothetical protein BDV26DRAFT_289857 [Aspergillus bertholletiae]
MVATITALLSPAPSQIALTFLVLGAVFHQAIRTTEIENRIWSLAALYLGTWLSVCIRYIHTFSFGWFHAVGWTCLAACFFNLGLVTNIILYRAFFHRLRQFPGPWMARLSRLYIMQQGVKRTQYHLDLEEMHRKYGDFVRTGPREISINRPSAVHIIHGPQSSCIRSTLYGHISDDNSRVSLNTARDPEVHRRRRRAWDRGFSSKGERANQIIPSIYLLGTNG